MDISKSCLFHEQAIVVAGVGNSPDFTKGPFLPVLGASRSATREQF